MYIRAPCSRVLFVQQVRCEGLACIGPMVLGQMMRAGLLQLCVLWIGGFARDPVVRRGWWEMDGRRTCVFAGRAKVSFVEFRKVCVVLESVSEEQVTSSSCNKYSNKLIHSQKSSRIRTLL